MTQIKFLFPIIVICLLAVPVADCSDAEASLVPGAWELVELSPVSMMDSNPRGFANHREYYRGDGSICFLRPSEAFSEVKNCLAVRFDGNSRVITGPDGSERFSTVIDISKDLVTIQFPDESIFSFKRLDDRNGLLPIKPQSLHVLEVNEGPQLRAQDVNYLNVPRSAAKRQLVGVWEVIEYRDVPSNDMPPYGFPNYKWVFEKERWAQISPTSDQVSEDEWFQYTFDGAVLRFEGGEAEKVNVSFSRWGDLLLSAQSEQMTLRQLTTDPDEIPVLPFKVCVLANSNQ